MRLSKPVSKLYYDGESMIAKRSLATSLGEYFGNITFFCETILTSLDKLMVLAWFSNDKDRLDDSVHFPSNGTILN